jgi:hypothetical protein
LSGLGVCEPIWIEFEGIFPHLWIVVHLNNANSSDGAWAHCDIIA